MWQQQKNNKVNMVKTVLSCLFGCEPKAKPLEDLFSDQFHHISISGRRLHSFEMRCRLDEVVYMHVCSSLLFILIIMVVVVSFASFWIPNRIFENLCVTRACALCLPLIGPFAFELTTSFFYLPFASSSRWVVTMRMWCAASRPPFLLVRFLSFCCAVSSSQ